MSRAKAACIRFTILAWFSGVSYAKGNNIKDNRSHAATAETSWIYINTLLLQSLSEVAFFICYHLLQTDDVFM
jgi:hypothetical protein